MKPTELIAEVFSAGPLSLAASTLAPMSDSVPATTRWVVRVPLSITAIGTVPGTPWAIAAAAISPTNLSPM